MGFRWCESARPNQSLFSLFYVKINVAKFLKIVSFIVQIYKILCGGSDAPGSDLPHKIMWYWFCYSSRLADSFPRDQNGRAELFSTSCVLAPRGQINWWGWPLNMFAWCTGSSGLSTLHSAVIEYSVFWHPAFCLRPTETTQMKNRAKIQCPQTLRITFEMTYCKWCEYFLQHPTFCSDRM